MEHEGATGARILDHPRHDIQGLPVVVDRTHPGNRLTELELGEHQEGGDHRSSPIWIKDVLGYHVGLWSTRDWPTSHPERETVAGLAVSLAAPRLRREGVPVGPVLDDPERRLFDLLSRSDGDLAHARYTAYLRRLASFADACRIARLDEDPGAT